MGFWSSLFGRDDKPGAPTVVQQASKFPEELAPYIKELLGEAQRIYGEQKELGYQPYTKDTIAPLSSEELQAQEGLKGLVGTTTPYLEEALDIYRTGAEKFTPEAAQEYMSPYQRAVTDIEKREAQKVFERDIMPRFEKQAVQAGGMSGLGSRAGIQAGQLGQAQMQQMGDIEAKGLQRAYMDAQKGFADQKARERQMAGDIGRAGPAMFQAGLADQGLLQDIGQQKRERGQLALDEAYSRFLQEQAYPQNLISQYSGTVYGAPSPGPSYTRTSTGPSGLPSSGQQLLGLGLAGLNIFGSGGGFSGGWSPAKMFDPNSWRTKAGGGKIGGLSSLPVVHRQTSGMVDYFGDYEEEPKTISESISLRIPQSSTSSNIGIKDMMKVIQDLKPTDYGFDQTPILEAKQKLIEDQRELFKKQAAETKTDTQSKIEKKRKRIEQRANRWPSLALALATKAVGESPTLATSISGATSTFLGQINKDTKELDKARDKLSDFESKAKSEELAASHKQAKNELINDANAQIEYLKLSQADRMKVMEMVKTGTSFLTALATYKKATKGTTQKFTEPVRKAIEKGSLSDLGFLATYEDGKLVSITSKDRKELDQNEVKVLAQYQRDFMEGYAYFRGRSTNEALALSRAREYARKKHLKSTPAGTPPPASGGTPSPAGTPPPPASGGNTQNLIQLSP